MTTHRIFEGETKQQALDTLLDAGYVPAGPDELRGLVHDGDIPSWRLYHTNWARFPDGSERELALAEMRALEDVYAEEGCVLFLGDRLGLLGDYVLDDGGRFVGVAPEAQPDPLDAVIGAIDQYLAGRK